MERKNRVKNSSRNLMFGMAAQVTTLILKFIVRTYFIKCLGESYLGVNGLFRNILSILSLAEMGFSTAMVYSMYKPLAESNNDKLAALMLLYKKVYSIIGIIVALLGLLVIPLMDYIIKDKPNIDYLTLIYVMFLADSVLSYLFFAYKRSILIADQRAFIVSKYRYIFEALKSIIQILVLLVFKNFILYLFVQMIITLIENIFISKKVDKLYPFLRIKEPEKLVGEEIRRIKDDVKALVLSNIGRVAINGTDNIIISGMVGLIWVGKLSNYTLITTSLIMILSQVSSAITGSVGNFIASEDKKNYYFLFRRIDFLNFWFYGFSAIALIVLVNPFITIWLGRTLVLSQLTAIVISINFLIDGMLQSLWMFRTTMGLFVQGKYRPLFTAVINLVVSIMLAQYIGVIGVLLGTTISRLLVNAWFDPYIIYKHGFGRQVKSYYSMYLRRVALMSCILVPLLIIRSLLFGGGISLLGFVILMMITATVPNFLFFIVYRKSTEFKYFINLVKSLFSARRAL